MKRIFSSFLIILSCAQYLKASVGTDAAAFLKIDAGARAAALGGAFTAIADDASSIFYNPAGPSLLQNTEIMLTHNEWFEGLRIEHISVVVPLLSLRNTKDFTFFIGFTALTSPTLEKYDVVGNKTGSFTAIDRAIVFGNSFAIGKNFMAGVLYKVITQQADKKRDHAYAADLGFIQNFADLRLGLSIQNIGDKMKLYETKFKLPLTYRVGAAYRLMKKYWVSFESVKLGEADVSFGLGAEGEFNLSQSGKGYIRCGYNGGRSENTGSGVSAGLGFSVSRFMVDYAFAPFGDLGDTHRFTLGFKFGKEEGPIPWKRADAVEFGKFESKTNNIVEEPVENQYGYAEENIQTAETPKLADNYEAYLEYAEDYFAQEDYKNAFIQYGNASEALSKDDKRQIYILGRQGLILIKQKNCVRAKRFYAVALKTAKRLSISNKNVVNAYLGLAYCQEKTGSIKWAITNYNAAWKLTSSANVKRRIEKALNGLKTNRQY